MKIKHVHPEIYEDCMMFHQKVRQEILVNNALSVAFARAFTYENCTSTRELTYKLLYWLAWALASEILIDRALPQDGKFTTKDGKNVEHDN